VALTGRQYTTLEVYIKAQNTIILDKNELNIKHTEQSKKC